MDVRGEGSLGARRAWPLLARALLVAAPLALGTGSAHADAECGKCPAPANETVREAAGEPFSILGGGWTFSVDGGECRARFAGARRNVDGYEVVWQGTGSSWNCPFSKSGSTISVSLSDTQRFRWHLEGSVGFEFGSDALAKIKASLGGGTDDENVKVVTGGVSKTIDAGYCHRVDWTAVFLAQHVTATVDVHVERRWSWWVKSDPYGSAVAAAGEMWVPCGTFPATFQRLEPLYLAVALRDRRCPDCNATETVPPTSWWPPLPTGLPPITPFPPDDEPEPERPPEEPPVVPPPVPPPPPPPPDSAPPPPPPDGTKGTGP